MSTRSVIGAEHTNEKGRYCHYDGYAGGNGIELIKLIQREGAEKTIDVLVDKHYGWSSIDSNQSTEKFEKDVEKGVYDERFGIVPGFGIFYTEEDGMTPDDWSGICSEEWGYILHKNGDIDVYAYKKKLGTVNAFADNAIETMKAFEKNLE